MYVTVQQPQSQALVQRAGKNWSIQSLEDG